MPPRFPDHSAQEEILRTDGDTELLRKRGIRQIRVKKKVQSSERDLPHAELVATLATGIVFEVGVGLGQSTNLFLAKPEVTHLYSIERNVEIKRIFEEENTDDPRHTLTVGDAYVPPNRPDGPFDLVFLDINYTVSQPELVKARNFLNWAEGELNPGGKMVVNYFSDDFDAALTQTIQQILTNHLYLGNPNTPAYRKALTVFSHT